MDNQNQTNFNKYAELDDTDKAIINLIIQFPSITNTDIAKELNLERQTIIARKKKKLFKEVLLDLQKSALQYILDNQKKASEKLVSLIDSRNENVAINACKEILKNVLPEKHEITGKDGEALLPVSITITPVKPTPEDE